MGKHSFFPRLALVNLLRNSRYYGPYLLSCGAMAAMYYILRFLTWNEVIQTVRGAAYLQAMMSIGCFVVALFSVVLLLYANSFVMKRRQKELGIYNILGLEKRHIAALCVWETLLCAAAVIPGGIAAGILLSKLILLLLLKLVQIPVQFGFSISIRGMGETAALLGVLFLLALLWNLLRLGRSRPIELLHSNNAGEREPKTKRLLAVLGLAALLGGYAIALTTRNPVNALMLFFVAVILVMLGTYCLFTAGSISLLKCLRANVKFYYQTRHFTAVSGLLYRMKQNAVGLANICILACMVLVTVSGTLCLYLGAEKSLDGKYPDDILVTQTLEDSVDSTAILDLVQRTIANAGRQVRDICYEQSISFHAKYSGNTLLTDLGQNGLLTEVTVLTAEEYSRLTGDTVSLEENEVLACADGDLPLPETFFYEGEPIRVRARLDSFPAGDSAIVTNEANLGLVADDSLAEQIMDTDLARRTFRIHLNTDGTDSEKLACAKAVLAVSDGRYGVASRQEMAEEFYAMYGGFLFLGIFLGLLFLMATVLIIYYKQISEGYEDQHRYRIMQQVGMSHREVGASIRGQILLVFFLPLMAAGVHILAAFPMLCRILELFGLHDVGLFALCTVGTLAVFAAVYALVYFLTAWTYERIVGSAA
ncbi:putative ABC transport system permease protein [Oscillibacter sp. PC13]|uniref:FtsX-like permease family protein n=1 Tax=Oscillibacter sp. PC13 TaxID=1855299 RepID=UPI0008EA68AF|nr:FtsX-like permease family protein [Oscillibacter sp. PC13]SFP26025.1 putative ABC transport system permease protein [Oscillibacter sp. PC13]